MNTNYTNLTNGSSVERRGKSQNLLYAETQNRLREIVIRIIRAIRVRKKRISLIPQMRR